MAFEEGTFARDLLGAYGVGESDVVWPEASRLGLASLVMDLGEGGGDVEEIAKRRRQYKVRQMLLRIVAQDVVGVLGSVVRVILLKGEPLAEELYGGGMRRSGSDVDLLVLPGDLEVVAQRLEGNGYRRCEELSAQTIQTNKEWKVRHEKTGVIVEIHWQVSVPALPGLPLASLFETRRLVDLQGVEVPVMREDWLFLYLVLHFYNHFGFARGLLDIAAWFDRFGDELDLERIRRLADENGLSLILQWPLHTMEALIGRRPPLWRKDPGMGVKGWAALSAKALRDCMIRRSTSRWERSCQQPLLEVGTWATVVMMCGLGLMVEGQGSRLENGVRPLLYGPHRYGRFLVGLRQ